MLRLSYAARILGLFFLLPIAAFAQVADFSATPTTGCAPVVVSFTDLSTGGALTYDWDFGDFQPHSSSSNPIHTYTDTGCFTVTLIVTNGSGSDTMVKPSYICIGMPPVVDFVADDTTSQCPPKTVCFSTTGVILNSAGTPTYLWDFGDGFASSSPNPCHTYTASGCFNVTLTVTNGAGCATTLTKMCYIHTFDQPNSNFTSASNQNCNVPAVVTFTHAPAGGVPGVTYTIDYDGPGPLAPVIWPTATPSMSHTYTVAGSYDVTVTAFNTSTGCSSSTTKPAFVRVGLLDADFTMSNDSVCTGGSLTFTNATADFTDDVPPLTMKWYVDNVFTSTSTSISPTFGTPGPHTIKLVVAASSCKDSITKTITVVGPPTVSVTADTFYNCTAPLLVCFDNTSPAWPPGSVITFSPGLGPTLTINNAAGDTCFNYTSMGTFCPILTITTPLGCVGSATLAPCVSIAPPIGTITATLDSGCAPLNPCFSGVISAGTISTYAWSFPGGTPSSSSAASPCVTYSSPGGYTDTLTFTTTAGCIGVVTHTTKVGSTPVVTMVDSVAGMALQTKDSVCINTKVYFKHTVISGNITSRILYIDPTSPAGPPFSAPHTTVAAAPFYVYNTPGTYYPTWVFRDSGCEVYIRDTLIVHGIKATFSSNSYSCAATQLDTLKRTGGGTADSVHWTVKNEVGTVIFSDTTAMAIVNFPTCDTYFAQLYVEDQYGCWDTATQMVTIGCLNCNFTVSTTDTCIGAAVTFTTDHPVSYQNKFFFGDGTSTTITGAHVSVTHAYDTLGTFFPFLVVKDVAKGCTDTCYGPAITITGPTVSFVTSDAALCIHDITTFTGTSTSTSGAITSNAWHFGDGFSGTGSPVNHQYDTAGLFDVTLVATDASGCMDSLTKDTFISVLNPPIGNFFTNDTAACPGSDVQFINLSSGVTDAWWDFGDGFTGTGANPIHNYTDTSGYFTVTMVAYNANGCPSDTIVKTNYIHIFHIQALFSMSDSFATCPPLDVCFTNNSIDADHYFWEFGNGNTASVPNPCTVFSSADTFSITLIAISTLGCQDSTKDTVVVLGPTGDLVYTPISGCAPLDVMLAVINTNSAQFIFDTRDGFAITTTADTIYHTYTSCGAYVPLVVLTDGVSCTYPLVGADTVRPECVTADFTFTPDSACQYTQVDFYGVATATYNPIDSFLWDFDDAGATAIGDTVTHFFTNGGVHNVRLIAVSSQGCRDTVYHNVYTIPNPIFVPPSDTEVCLGSTQLLTVSVVGGVFGSTYTYFWTPCDATLTLCDSSTVGAHPVVNTTYTVYVTASTGCMDTLDVHVVVRPLPNIVITGDTTICEEEVATLTGTGAGPSGFYTWIAGGPFSCDTCVTTNDSSLVTQSVILAGFNQYGCEFRDTTTLVVTPLPDLVINAVPGEICDFDSTQITVTGATTYVWNPGSTSVISCNTCQNPIAYPHTTTTFYVTGTASGCSTTDSLLLVVHPLPPVTAGNDQNICVGDTTLLIAGGALDYTWAGIPSGSYFSCDTCSSTLVYPTLTTTYTVTGTDIFNCVNTDQVVVNVMQHVPTSVGPDASICRGESTQLSAFGGTNYLWSPDSSLDNATSATPIATPDSSTIYIVLITENICFVDTYQVYVQVNPVPTVDAGPAVITIYGGESITIPAVYTDASIYLWSPPDGLSCIFCPNPIASPIVTTTYTIDASNEWGCKASDTVRIRVVCDSMVFMPNTFTPNGDGQNDIFYPRLRGKVTIKGFHVYDRWGEEVFAIGGAILANDINAGWDGTYKGVPLKPDVYIYYIDLICLDGEEQTLKGDISLIR